MRASIRPGTRHLVDAGIPVKKCCRVLGVSSPGYYRYKNRPTSATQLRREWLTGLIREIPRRLPRHLRLPPHPRRAHDGDERPGQLPADLGADDPGRYLRLPGAGADQAAPGCRDQRGPGQPEVPSAGTERTVGYRHHRTPDPARARSSAPPSWTPTAAGSWVGRSTLAKTARWSSTPSTWPSAIAGPHRAGSCTPTTESSSPHGHSATRSAPRADFVLQVRRRRLGQRDDGVVLVLDADRAAQSHESGRPGSSWPTRSSSTSRSSTTANDATPASATAPRSSTNYAPKPLSSPPETPDANGYPSRRARHLRGASRSGEAQDRHVRAVEPESSAQRGQRILEATKRL